MLLGDLGSQSIQVNISGRLAVLRRLMVFDQGIGYIRTASQKSFAFGGQIGPLLLGSRRSYRSGRHCAQCNFWTNITSDAGIAFTVTMVDGGWPSKKFIACRRRVGGGAALPSS